MTAEKNHQPTQFKAPKPVFLRLMWVEYENRTQSAALAAATKRPDAIMTDTATTTQVGEGADARGIAVRHRDGADQQPGLVWLGGYRSDMAGTKAVELDRLACENGLSCTRFDYSGHGESGGDFNKGTISRWLEESLAVFDRFTNGPQILVGSSMGGWIALRMVQELKSSGQSDRSAVLCCWRRRPISPANCTSRC